MAQFTNRLGKLSEQEIEAVNLSEHAWRIQEEASRLMQQYRKGEMTREEAFRRTWRLNSSFEAGPYLWEIARDLDEASVIELVGRIRHEEGDRNQISPLALELHSVDRWLYQKKLFRDGLRIAAWAPSERK